MKKFFIYQKDMAQNDDVQVYNYRCLKDGFYFSALIFNLFWLLYMRLWSYGLSYLILSLVISLTSNWFTGAIYAQFFLMAAVGIIAPVLLHKKLLADGYELTSIIYEKNQDLALLNYLRNKNKLENLNV